jgi:cytochrome c oxidase subunit 2
MGSTGKVAFSVILGLGALTGILAYYLFQFAAPEPGIMYSVSRVDLPPPTTTSTTSPNGGGAGNITTTTPASGNGTSAASPGTTAAAAAATLTIPQGASIQGNPAYDPDSLTVKKGDTIAVENKDTTPHTVTNGKAATDPNMGKLFDTSIINGGESSEIVTADLQPGDHPYFCSVHPYMTGTITIG